MLLQIVVVNTLKKLVIVLTEQRAYGIFKTSFYKHKKATTKTLTIRTRYDLDGKQASAPVEVH